MGARDQLERIIVRNPGIDMLPDETCYYYADTKLGEPYQEYVTTTKTKPGLGVGFRITKHLGIGIGRQKVTTTTEAQTVWDKTPCEFYLLDSRIVLKTRKDESTIQYDSITDMKVNRDALTICTKYKDYYFFMPNKDVKRFMEVFALLGEVAKEEGGTTKSAGTDQISTESPNMKRGITDVFVKTIFLDSFSRGAHPIMKRDEYAKFFFYDLNIQNAAKYHKGLIEDGYFEPASLEELMDTLRMPEVRDLIKKHGLNSARKKADMIATLMENVPAKDLAALFPTKQYVLSAEGKAFLEEHDDYVRLWQHRGWQISPEEFDKLKSSGGSFSVICEQIFNQRILYQDRYYEQRAACYNLASLMKDEERFQEALTMLLRTLYYDVNGLLCGSLDAYKKGFIKKKEYLERASQEIFFAPAILKEIGDLEDYFSEDMIPEVYASSKKLLRLCPESLFGEMVHSIIDGDFDEEYFKKRLAEEYRKA